MLGPRRKAQPPFRIDSLATASGIELLAVNRLKSSPIEISPRSNIQWIVPESATPLERCLARHLRPVEYVRLGLLSGRHR